MPTTLVNIVTFLEARRGFISRLASHYHLEFDDLYQESALIALEKSSDAGKKDDPEAYLAGCIKMQAFLLSHRRHQHVSLDKPFDVGGEQVGCLADVLPAASPVPASELAATDQRITSVHKALHRLPREEQDYLQRVYHLASFRPLSRPGHKVKHGRAVKALSGMAFKHLRKDAALAAAALAGGVR